MQLAGYRLRLPSSSYGSPAPTLPCGSRSAPAVTTPYLNPTPWVPGYWYRGEGDTRHTPLALPLLHILAILRPERYAFMAV